MKAIVFEQFGEPAEVLQVRDVPLPEPGPGQVRVRMIASPINPSDLLVVRGRYGVLPELPATPGFEGVGVVDKVGPGLLGRLVEGKRVTVINHAGGNWAEYAVIPARQARPVPDRHPRRAGGLVLRQPGDRAGDGPARPAGPARGVAAPVGGRLDPGQDDHQAGQARRLQDPQRRPPPRGDRRAEGAGRRRRDLRRPTARSTSRFAGSTGGEGVRHAIDPVGGETGTQRLPVARGRAAGCSSTARSPASRSRSIPRLMIAGQASRSRGSGWATGCAAGASRRPCCCSARSPADPPGVLSTQPGPHFGLDDIKAAVAASESAARQGKALLTLRE